MISEMIDDCDDDDAVPMESVYLCFYLRILLFGCLTRATDTDSIRTNDEDVVLIDDDDDDLLMMMMMMMMMMMIS